MAIREQMQQANGVDLDLLRQIEALRLSPRLAREREEFFKREVEITADRSVLAMESWKETEGDVLDIRWAKMARNWAERMPVVIFKEQLVVGSETKLFCGAEPWVESEAPEVLETMEEGKHRIRMSAARLSQCADEAWEALDEAVHFFLGKTSSDVVADNMRQLYGDWPDDFQEARGWRREGRNNVGPLVPLWEKLFGKGLRGVIQEAEAGIGRVRSGEEPDAKKAWFWEAVVMCCKAVIHYSHRYATLARELCLEEQDPGRRKELEQIAQNCERVPEFPARTLQEAIQSRTIWGVAMQWCRPNNVDDQSGRMDQYLYHYFMSDIREGRLTLEQVAELVAMTLSNLARRDGVKSVQLGQMAQGTLINQVVLGGLTPEGRDANNELTYLILHMAALMRYAEPHYTFRVNAGTPNWALRKAMETNRIVGGGQPQFMSDDHVMNYLMGQGTTLEDARDWVGYG